MDPERQNNSLDDALRGRTAMAPTSGFTGIVLARLNAKPRRPAFRELVTDYGVRGGLWLAAAGGSTIVDANRLGEKLTAALVAPDGATAVVVLTISLVWVLTRIEPEGEAL